VSPSLLNAALPAPAAVSLTVEKVIEGWEPGQVLQARVVETLAAGRVALLIAGHRLQATATQPLQQGEALTVQVESRGPPVVLRPLDQPSRSAPPSAAPAAVPPPADGETAPLEIQRAVLRDLLPRAGPLGPALAALREAARADPAGPEPAARLEPAVRDAVRAVLSSVAQPAEVTTGEGLRRAVDRSGLFLEARLALAPPGESPPLDDLKTLLLRLAALLSKATGGGEALVPGAAPARSHPPQPDEAEASPPRGSADRGAEPPQAPPAAGLRLPAGASPRPAPPGGGVAPSTPAPPAPDRDPTEGLRRQVEAALARIELNQVRSTQAADGALPAWRLDLPVARGDGADVLTLELRPDGHEGNGQSDAAWFVTLHLALEPLGPLHARVVWRTGQVSATLWAERPGVARLLERHAPELAERLATAGLSVSGIHCLEGAPPAPRQSTPPGDLLDLQA
jgi:hypothetical protein